jgi:cytochrome c oxidase assembly factor CtaG
VTPAQAVVILLAVLGLYFVVMSRTAEQLPHAQQRQHLAFFVLGLVAVLLGFVPSPDLLGPDHRFAVNMSQFVLVVDIGPLLLFLGIPVAWLQSLLRWDTLGRRLTQPLVCALVSSALLVGWHMPVLFEAASGDLPTWLLKQLLFVFAGLVLWWPVAGPLAAWRPPYPVRLVYIFLVRVPTVLVGVMFTFADQLIYASRSFALEICAPSSLSDQVAGGLVMSTAEELIMFLVLSIVFLNWRRAAEAATPH